MWKWPWPTLRFQAGTCMKGLRKPIKRSQPTQCQGRDVKWRPPRRDVRVSAFEIVPAFLANCILHCGIRRDCPRIYMQLPSYILHNNEVFYQYSALFHFAVLIIYIYIYIYIYINWCVLHYRHQMDSCWKRSKMGTWPDQVYSRARSVNDVRGINNATLWRVAFGLQGAQKLNLHTLPFFSVCVYKNIQAYCSPCHCLSPRNYVIKYYVLI